MLKSTVLPYICLFISFIRYEPIFSMYHPVHGSWMIKNRLLINDSKTEFHSDSTIGDADIIPTSQV